MGEWIVEKAGITITLPVTGNKIGVQINTEMECHVDHGIRLK